MIPNLLLQINLSPLCFIVDIIIDQNFAWRKFLISFGLGSEKAEEKSNLLLMKSGLKQTTLIYVKK